MTDNLAGYSGTTSETGSEAATNRGRAIGRKITVGSDSYEVDVLVDDADRFLGILEIRAKKDFRSIRQKIASTGYLDVDEFYQD